MAIKTIDNLRAMVVDIVKVKANTDPTKTQGIRLRQLLNDILDTVQDLVNQLGLSVLSEMQANEDVQNQHISDLQSKFDSLQQLTTNYNDLAKKSDIPQIPVYDFSIYALKAELFSKQYSELKNTPDLSVYALKGEIPTYDLSIYQKKSEAFSGSWNSLTDKPTLFNGSYTSLSNKPDLSVYALKSDIITYDLTKYALKTDIPASQDLSSYAKKSDITSQVNSDWNSTGGVSQILNKPTLFNGTYAALTGKPTLFDGAYTSLTGIPTSFTPAAHTHIISSILGLQAFLDSITKYYISTGLVTQNLKKWTTIVTPTTSQGFSVDISSAGFTTILGVQVQVERNTSTVSDVPQVALKTKSATTLTFNIIQTNTAVVNIAGVNVLSGLPLIFAINLSTINLHIEVTGY